MGNLLEKLQADSRGLRYLENFEFGLVFEALSERALLLKTAPHMVRPLPFYFPVYEGDAHGKGTMKLGMWLYDLLAMFRTPEFHKTLSAAAMTKDIPFIRQPGLKGGFRYYDASMWDDVLAVQTLRSAHSLGAAIANYVEALAPLYGEPGNEPLTCAERRRSARITGFRDPGSRECPKAGEKSKSTLNRLSSAPGPWTDILGPTLAPGMASMADAEQRRASGF